MLGNGLDVWMEAWMGTGVHGCMAVISCVHDSMKSIRPFVWKLGDILLWRDISLELDAQVFGAIPSRLFWA